MRRRGWASLHALALMTVLAAAAAACDPATGPPLPSSEPVLARAADHDFVLEVRLPARTFRVADAIPLTTTLTWTGAADSQTVWGSGMGPVGFSYDELTGPKREIGGAMTLDCGAKAFARGQPIRYPPGKGVAYSASDPEAAFYEAWSKDPLLRFPAGTWRIHVVLDGYLAPCAAGAPELHAAVEVDVTVQ